jgi:hypothetical protein
MATSPSTSPLFSASCARRIVSTLLDIGQSQYPGRRAPVATQQPEIGTRDPARCWRGYWSERMGRRALRNGRASGARSPQGRAPAIRLDASAWSQPRRPGSLSQRHCD